MKSGKRMMSLALSLSMLLANVPVSAAEWTNGTCAHHTEHTAECTGQEEGAACTYQCADCAAETSAVTPAADLTGADGTEAAAETERETASDVPAEETEEVQTETEEEEPQETSSECAEQEVQEPVTEAGSERMTENWNETGTETDTEEAETENAEETEAYSEVSADSEEAERLEQVRDMIAALPTLEALKAMSLQEQRAVYETVQQACDAFESLSEEAQQQLAQEQKKLEELLDYLNAQTEMATGAAGYCGTNVRWGFDGATLTIYGSGAMDNYQSGAGKPPWEEIKTNVTTVIVEAGVTQIGEYAFYAMPNLQSATIQGNSKIGNFAFRSCPALTTVSFSGTVGQIGTNVFNGDSKISSLSLLAGEGTSDVLAFIGVSKNAIKLLDSKGVDVTSSYECSIDSNGVLTIKELKQEMTGVSAKDVSVTYDGQPHSITVTGVPDGASITYSERETGTYKDWNPTLTNAGTITVYYQVTAPGYKPASGSATLTITPKKISECNASTVEDQTYTGFEIKPKIIVKDPVRETNLIEGTDYTLSYSNNINAGIGTAKITLTGKGNYSAEYSTYFSIFPATMTITGEPYIVGYDGEAHSITLNGVPEGATVTYADTEDGTYTTEKPSFVNAGTYTVYYKVEKANYRTVTGKIWVQINQITNRWTTKPSLDSWTYGETAKTPSYAAKFGTVKVEYGYPVSEEAYEWKEEIPTQAGRYKARFSVEETGNYAGLTITCSFTINQVNLTIRPVDKSKTYGEGDPELTWTITEGALVGNDQLETITLSRKEGEAAGVKAYNITAAQTEGANPNYRITFQTGYFTILKRTIEIVWGDCELVYDRTMKCPQASVGNKLGADEVEFIVDGGAVNVGTYTATVKNLTGKDAKNYQLPDAEECSVPFKIMKADREAPKGLNPIAETIKGKADGKIYFGDTEETYEYRKETETAYQKVALEGNYWNNVASGTYYIRYAESANYKASAEAAVTMTSARSLKITLPGPSEQEGYTITVDEEKPLWKGTAVLRFSLKPGYSKDAETFQVKLNGTPVTLSESDQYEISDIQDDIQVTVEGVKDLIPPKAAIILKSNEWDTLTSDISSELFFKNGVTVTFRAEDVDTGSGLKAIYAYFSEKEMTEAELKLFEDYSWWATNPNNLQITLNNGDEGILYVKAVDHAGNAAYISSGSKLIVDTDAPVIKIAEGFGFVYGDTRFTVKEKHLDQVFVDGTPVVLTDGGYTILADGQEHTIKAVDKAGNESSEDKITPIPIASLDDEIEALTVENVTEDNLRPILSVFSLVERLLEGEKVFTEIEEQQLKEMKDRTEKLLERIADVERQIIEIGEELSKYAGGNWITSENRPALQALVAKINGLLNGKNLTLSYISYLEEVKGALESCLEDIEETEEKRKELLDQTSLYQKETVTSKDQEALEDLLEEILELIDSNHLTETEKKEMEAAGAKAEELLKQIEKAEEAGSFENVQEITEETVTVSDKETLESTKERLEQALEDYQGNLTETEKEKIESELDRIKELLEVIERVAAAEEKIRQLPNTITGKDAAAVEVAKEAFEALSEYEQSMVDPDLSQKLEQAQKDLKEAKEKEKEKEQKSESKQESEKTSEKEAAPNTADTSSLLFWTAALLASGLAALMLLAERRRRRV